MSPDTLQPSSYRSNQFKIIPLGWLYAPYKKAALTFFGNVQRPFTSDTIRLTVSVAWLRHQVTAWSFNKITGNWVMRCMRRIAIWISLRWRFRVNLLLYRKVGQNSIQIIKRHNCEKLFHHCSQTKLKQERRNWTINGKNWNCCQCYYGNGVRRRTKKYKYIDKRRK